MQTADPQRYDIIAILMHWVLALLIISQIIAGRFIVSMEPSVEMITYYAWHKSFGLIIFGLIIFRIIWRLKHPPPPLLNNGATARLLAVWGHRVIYILLIAIPLFGLLGSFASGFGVSLFNMVTLPNPIPESEALEALFFNAHKYCSRLLAVLALGHAIMAIYHHSILKDATLTRMLPKRQK